MSAPNTSASTLAVDDTISTKPLKTTVRLDLTWAQYDPTTDVETGVNVPRTGGIRILVGFPSVDPQPHTDEVLSDAQVSDLSRTVTDILAARLVRTPDQEPLSAEQVKAMLAGEAESELKKAVSRAFEAFRVPWVLGEVAEMTAEEFDGCDAQSDCESCVSDSTAVGSVADMEKEGKEGVSRAGSSCFTWIKTCLGVRK